MKEFTLEPEPARQIIKTCPIHTGTEKQAHKRESIEQEASFAGSHSSQRSHRRNKMSC